METPSYYAIIPADVRYSELLSANAKLLYGEITCLSQKEGYCFATNDYFAKLYKKDGGTISRWVSELVNAGFVTSLIDVEAGNKRRLRLSSVTPKITPIRKNANSPILKNEGSTIRKNANRPTRKNAMIDNNTSTNNTSINKVVVVVGENENSTTPTNLQAITKDISAPTPNIQPLPQPSPAVPVQTLETLSQQTVAVRDPFSTNIAAIVADREHLDATREVRFGKLTEQEYADAVLSTSAYREQAIRCSQFPAAKLPELLTRFTQWNAGIEETHRSQSHFNSHLYQWIGKQKALLEKEVAAAKGSATTKMTTKEIAAKGNYL